jgi:hypothetical protein
MNEKTQQENKSISQPASISNREDDTFDLWLSTAISLANIESDTAQYRKERIEKLKLELQTQSKLTIEKPAESKPNPIVKEITFTLLIYAPQQGAKLGAYETATKPTKDNATWTYAYNILKTNNATIQNRYHEEGYQYSYWLMKKVKFTAKN